MKNSTYKLAQFRESNDVRKVHGVFIVESSKILRAGLRCSLNSFDTVRVIAESEYQNNLCECIQTSGANIVIFSSFSLEGDCLDLIKSIKADLVSIKVIAISDEPDEEEFFETVKAGIEGYCCKNDQPFELIEAINLVASGERYIHKSMNTFVHRIIQHMGKMRQSPIDKPIEELSDLTAREHEVAELLCLSLTNNQIAKRLCISLNTVKLHVSNVFKKIGVKNRVEAVLKYNEIYGGFGI